MAGVWERPAGPAALAGWKLRDGVGDPAATHWARPGGGVAPRGLGAGFPADSPESAASLESRQLPAARFRGSRVLPPPLCSLSSPGASL